MQRSCLPREKVRGCTAPQRREKQRATETTKYAVFTTFVVAHALIWFYDAFSLRNAWPNTSPRRL